MERRRPVNFGFIWAPFSKLGAILRKESSKQAISKMGPNFFGAVKINILVPNFRGSGATWVPIYVKSSWTHKKLNFQGRALSEFAET